MKNKNLFVFIIFFNIFCKSSQQIENIEKNQNQQSSTQNNITITEEKKEETQITSNPQKEQTGSIPENTNTTITEENKKITVLPIISNTDKNKILSIKESIFNEENIYLQDRNTFIINKNNIKSISSIIIEEENLYTTMKKNYLFEKEENKKSIIETLNSIDPERLSFWRVDANKEFPEILIFYLQLDEEYYICETSNELKFYLLKEDINCNNIIKKINFSFLENRNFFEEISIFELLPDTKGTYFILKKQSNNSAPVILYNNKNEMYYLNFIETDGKFLLKLNLSQIKNLNGKNRYYFKIITPLNILFRIP